MAVVEPVGLSHFATPFGLPVTNSSRRVLTVGIQVCGGSAPSFFQLKRLGGGLYGPEHLKFGNGQLTVEYIF
jgi:hypothetical protein